MNISAWSIRNPVAAAMLFVLLSLAGLAVLQAMKVQNMPDIEVNYLLRKYYDSRH